LLSITDTTPASSAGTRASRAARPIAVHPRLATPPAIAAMLRLTGSASAGCSARSG
jgi:hypothetical protein